MKDKTMRERDRSIYGQLGFRAPTKIRYEIIPYSFLAFALHIMIGNKMHYCIRE